MLNALIWIGKVTLTVIAAFIIDTILKRGIKAWREKHPKNKVQEVSA